MPVVLLCDVSNAPLQKQPFCPVCSSPGLFPGVLALASAVMLCSVHRKGTEG